MWAWADCITSYLIRYICRWATVWVMLPSQVPCHHCRCSPKMKAPRKVLRSWPLVAPPARSYKYIYLSLSYGFPKKYLNHSQCHFHDLAPYKQRDMLKLDPGGKDDDRSSPGTPSDLADELLRSFEVGVSWCTFQWGISPLFCQLYMCY